MNSSAPASLLRDQFNCTQGIYTYMPPSNNTLGIPERFLLIEKQLCENLNSICVPNNVCHVYNPLEYAFNPHRCFIEKYCNSQKRILFVGMNPGPFGMSQNGVPFGECNIVRDWLEIKGEVSKPVNEHPKRLITGLDFQRSEVSGRRFWGLMREEYGTPDNFFKDCFVYNFCPLQFMSGTGKNIALPKMLADDLNPINTACFESLLEVIRLLNVETIIAIGSYAFNIVEKLMASANMHHIKVHRLLHPSGSNPEANRDWYNIARGQLNSFGIF